MLDKLSIASLTSEEIQTLQTEAALRIMGQIDVALCELNKEMYIANAEYYEAKRNLDDMKNTKALLVERARNLKAIVSNS